MSKVKLNVINSVSDVGYSKPVTIRRIGCRNNQESVLANLVKNEQKYLDQDYITSDNGMSKYKCKMNRTDSLNKTHMQIFFSMSVLLSGLS